MRFIYPAIIKEKEDGTFEAHFPDLAMCEAAGETMMEVVRNATAAAHDWIELEMSEEEPDFPPATDAADLVLGDKETLTDILVIYRMHEGWDE